MEPGAHSLLLSDLHLPAQPSPLRERFCAFLSGMAIRASAVYILGDLFEVWIGDDIGISCYADEIKALRGLSDRGVPVFVLHGNRDFLLGPQFAIASGVQIMSDPVVINLHGRMTLLTHGDQLCTDDVGYQRWRRLSRRQSIEQLFLKLPIHIRSRIAGGLRNESQRAQRSKSMSIMDVNTGAVDRWFSRYAVDRMIHGHTHRPAVHAHRLGDQRCERIVLPDWTETRCEVLRIDAEQFQLVSATS